MSISPEARPPLSATLSGDEFSRWYWLKDELAEFARLRGVRTTGGKDALAARIAAHLDCETPPDAPPSRPERFAQLTGSLTASTVVPRGQRCSQAVREWLTGEVGPTFHFDRAMREFFSTTDGTQTLRDARDHWHQTRGARKPEIDPQFEYNRFTRAWYSGHPSADRTSLLEAWREYRSRPVDQRGRA